MTSGQQKELFVQLIREHERLLFKVCHCYAGTVQDRNDLYQEIVLQCWSAWPRFNHQAKVSTWLYRVSLNTAISYRRKESRRIPVSGIEVELFRDMPAADAADEAQVTLLYRLIATLPDLERALLLLYFEERPHAEIADIIGISPANVATRLARIRAKLRQQAQNEI